MFTRLLNRHALTVVVVLGVFSSAFAAEPSADDVMNKNFYATKIKTLTSESTMILTNDRGEKRERNVKSWSKLQDDGIDSSVVIQFNKPADVRGTKFLQIQHGDRDDDMWIYLPALHKSRRLVSSNKKDSFVGTDFSYADILPPKPDKFRHTLLRSEKVDGEDNYVIESAPKDDNLKRDLGYAKRVSWIRKDNFVETKIDYYDADGQIARTQTATGHKLVEPDAKRWLVTKREMFNRRNNHRTSISVDKYDPKSEIQSRMFSVEFIERN